MFVMMNEIAPRRRRAGASRRGEDRLPGRRRLRPRPPAGPLAHRTEEPRRSRRPDPRPPGRAPHADGRPRHPGRRPRAFTLWTALRGDLAHRHPDEAVRQASEDVIGLDDPGAEGLPHRPRPARSARTPCQVSGGAGFTEHLRRQPIPARLPHHPDLRGTNRVQALDLVGRKLAANGGCAVMAFFSEIDAFVGTNGDERRPSRSSTRWPPPRMNSRTAPPSG